MESRTSGEVSHPISDKLIPVMEDDSKRVETALQEYGEATWDDSPFANLPREVQHVILERARQLKEIYERSKAVAA